MNKKAVAGIAAGVLITAGALGGSLAYLHSRENGKTVEVQQVSDIAVDDYASQITTYALIKKGESQEITFQSNQIINEIFVKAGDTVEPGTVLMQLDSTLQELDLEKAEIEEKKIDLEIRRAEAEVKKLENAEPYVEESTEHRSSRASESRSSSFDSPSTRTSRADITTPEPVETPASAPTTPVKTPEPTTPIETPEPTTPIETPEPTAPIETPEPTAPIETPAPTTPIETPAPTAPIETPAPTAPVETPAPTAPVETPAPTAPIETPAPTAPVETPEPTAPIETPAPTAPIETPAPTVPVETPAPTAPVETPAPTAPIETPAPTAPVETPSFPISESDTIYSEQQAVAGNGQQGSPYIFICNSDTYISTELLLRLISENKYSEFHFYNANGELQYIWQINGNTLGKAVSAEELSIDSKALEQQAVTSDDQSYVQIGESILSIYPDAAIRLTGSNSEKSSSEESSPEESAEALINYYTEEELNRLIIRKKQQIAELEVTKQQKNIEYQLAQKRLDETSIVSELAGTVESIGDIKDAANSGNAFLVIRENGEGMILDSTVSETMLDKIHNGTILSGEGIDENGNTIPVSAEVTSVSSYPTTENNADAIPNTSYYPFTAYIKDTEGLSEGMWVNLTLGTEDVSTSLYIEKIYVKEDEDGMNYVYAVNTATGLLEKRTVQTGKILYDTYIGIKSGLSKNDYIANPYAENIKEGRKVVQKKSAANASSDLSQEMQSLSSDAMAEESLEGWISTEQAGEESLEGQISEEQTSEEISEGQVSEEQISEETSEGQVSEKQISEEQTTQVMSIERQD